MRITQTKMNKTTIILPQKNLRVCLGKSRETSRPWKS